MEFDSDPVKAAITSRSTKSASKRRPLSLAILWRIRSQIPTIHSARNAGLCLAYRAWRDFWPLSLLTGVENIELSRRAWLRDMKEKLMKKAEEMRAEYRREDLGKGVRGKHFNEFKKGGNLVFLTPELAKIFPTNESVNAALSSLVGVARSATGLTSRASGRATKRRTA